MLTAFLGADDHHRRRKPPMASPIHQVGKNSLLSALPADQKARMEPHLDRVHLNLKEVIYEPNGPIPFVYFPLGGVVSLVVVMDDGLIVECATVGNEGLVGVPIFMGAERSPHKAFSQVPGDALRMPAADFRRETRPGTALHDVLQRYNQGLMNQMAYSVACNRLHSVEERMCRWLLMTRDRVGSDDFALTQEFLAQMLGVRRASVTVVAGVLQKAGFIAYSRGRISILDGPRLEAASCECYKIVQREFERLLT
jgi:CRP-like cAMP-binding protein